uniref:Uncharacterized protein n=1 Tax=Phlegmariurus squarrosus TaxID=73615 RepID=H9M899_PHLSQ|nr:hypothetical protein HusqMp128 [Phlegmariurus squarrosus]AEV55806.1 hypothetical protein HusqMp128 [Phlegmariurus squarrosus]
MSERTFVESCMQGNLARTVWREAMGGQPSENYFFAKRSSFHLAYPTSFFICLEYDPILFIVSAGERANSPSKHISLCVERRKLISYASEGKGRGRGSAKASLGFCSSHQVRVRETSPVQGFILQTLVVLSPPPLRLNPQIESPLC